jgi:quercetin dioxygenase-like cupin family protein
MANLAHRRVVTGINEAGQSCVIIDDTIPQLNPAMGVAVAWRTEGAIADNSGTADTAVPYDIALLHAGGSNFVICQFAPGLEAYMHATDTIDYLIVLSGRVTLVLETGEVDLGPGDFAVDRGVVHGWRNDHAEVCVCAVVNLPADPVGKGRTI